MHSFRTTLVGRMIAALILLSGLTVFFLIPTLVVSGILAWILAVVFLGWIPVGDTFLYVIFWEHRLPTGLVGGLVVFSLLFLPSSIEETKQFRRELRGDCDPVAASEPIATVTRRLANQAGIPEQDVYVVTRDRPESYTLGGKADGTIVLTSGLVDTLSDEELEPVLAHEISHLVNGDSRIMGIALVPVILTEDVGTLWLPLIVALSIGWLPFTLRGIGAFLAIILEYIVFIIGVLFALTFIAPLWQPLEFIVTVLFILVISYKVITLGGQSKKSGTWKSTAGSSDTVPTYPTHRNEEGTSLLRGVGERVLRIPLLAFQIAVAILSRGREIAADDGAVALTGSPGALASALRTLEDSRDRPVEDKRTWHVSAGALDILPPDDAGGRWGILRTHPRTEARIERLEAMAAEMETGDRR